MILSIITINFNNLEGLRKTIDSVLSQTWHDFEWIIIDGGSTDGSKELIEDTANKLTASDYNPLSFWCSESDSGIYNALNKGLSHCRGTYINCMNSGDEFYDNQTLEKLFSTSHNSDIIFGNSFHYSKENAFISHYPESVDLYFLYHSNICHQAMFVKTELLKASPFDEQYRICADYAKWLELMIQGCSFKYVPNMICRFDMTGLSNTGNLITIEREKIKTKYIPKYILPLIHEHDKYTVCGNRLIRAREILSKGGLLTVFFAAIIKTLYFIHKRL
ncbi:MAG: glycosyltransferase [Prevotella sp.]|nr:glycosyltransferase [Prevotella sp.]